MTHASDTLLSTRRRHDIDALRVFAFGLLILYHVGMFYVADWGWHIKSAYTAEWLQLPMLVVNQWRMPLLFLISGLAMSFIWGKYPAWRLAGKRTWRLLLPLVFGMAVICAPQAYYEAVSKGAIEPGFWEFMARYLRQGEFPADAWGGVEIATWTWTHLWYLPYLLSYTLVLIPLAAAFRPAGGLLQRGLKLMRGPWLILLPILPLMLHGLFIYPHFPEMSHALFDDWYSHAMYFTFFLYGFLLGRNPGVWDELKRLRKLFFALAVVSFTAYYGMFNWLPDDSVPRGVELLVIYLNRWLWVIMVLGWGYHLLNRPRGWLTYATEAVYPWYILHQTLTIVAGYHLSKLALGPVIEPLLVLLATFGGCYLLHEFVIRRVALLRPLFGLSFRPREPASPGPSSPAKLSAVDA
ncbi:MAG: acyltransferase family protein [Xanthomonadales bacterium]|nr:acyltransferase family protein [Xanthomonadales bacterium]